MNTWFRIGKVEKTQRGFEVIRFRDIYSTPCSLQMSSLARQDRPGVTAIWLGTDDAQPQVLASRARSYGIETSEKVGWVTYPIPEGVLLTTRMHLDRKQVMALIVHLAKWLIKGHFE